VTVLPSGTITTRKQFTSGAEAMEHRQHYTDAAFDRAAERRQDAAWLAARLADPGSRVLPVWRGRCLVRAGEAVPQALELAAHDSGAVGDVGHAVLLGTQAGIAWFALDVSHLDEAAIADELIAEAFELRDVALQLPRTVAALLAYARGMVHWHAGHIYCPACGGPTDAVRAGHARRCRADDCGRLHFPRTDPAVITLVHDGPRCVLARRAIWPAGRRSTIAGFVEPGETLEDAVRREVLEEIGLRVGRVHYQGSQPWPFPSSLMMGFHAEALSADIQVDGEEIAEADWYSRADIEAALAAGDLSLPPVDSISRWLVALWQERD